jgi:uncharacterized damage-inducible protein DinB
MSIAQAFLAELQHEAASTRKILALVPEDRADWTPHAKSFTLGKLALHTADMHRWIGMTIRETELDFAKGGPPPTFTTTAALVAMLDALVADASAALAGASDASLQEPWTLRAGPQVFFTMPRVQVLRSMVFNHIIHHRAQLSVYLRLLDIPIPGLYGPSADEK